MVVPGDIVRNRWYVKIHGTINRTNLGNKKFFYCNDTKFSLKLLFTDKGRFKKNSNSNQEWPLGLKGEFWNRHVCTNILDLCLFWTFRSRKNKWEEKEKPVHIKTCTVHKMTQIWFSSSHGFLYYFFKNLPYNCQRRETWESKRPNLHKILCL